MKAGHAYAFVTLICLVAAFFLAGCGGESTRPALRGLVYLSSLPGGALIHVDGTSTGALTPDTLSVRDGTHTLTLTLDGYRDSTFSFSMAHEDTISFDIKLAPLAGTLVWNQVTGIDATIFGIDFASLTYGCAVGENGRVFRTANSGVSWSEGTSRTSENLLSVSFSSSSIGWACGTHGVIIKTTDYGSTWDTMISVTSLDLHDIFFVNSTTGWAVGDSGKIIKTTDGGISWNPQSSGTAKNLTAVYFFNATLGWAVGGYLPGEGQIILRTTDGGITWSPTEAISGSSLRDVFFISPQVGLCVGDDGLIIRSTDGGISWNVVGSMKPLSLRALAAWSDVGFWAVGDKYGAFGEVVRSIDGGLTWYPFEETPHALLCVDAVRGLPNGWAGGVAGLWEYR